MLGHFGSRISRTQTCKWGIEWDSLWMRIIGFGSYRPSRKKVVPSPATWVKSGANPRTSKPRGNSEIPCSYENNSLILKIFSLLNSVGNCSRSLCSTAVSCYQISSLSPEIAIFPVKFPVSREFAWRRVRSALRRQPSSHSTGDSFVINLRYARQ
jgi:hypothetical protein